MEHDGRVRLVTYRGKSGITTLLPYFIGDHAGLVSIVSGKGSAYMTFFRSVFERRAPKSISPVEAVLGTELKQGNSTREFAQPLLEHSHWPTGKPPAIITWTSPPADASLSLA